MAGKLILISGPCVIENREDTLRIAEKLKNTAAKFRVELIFKASFDKANRLSVDSFRGVGLKEGMKFKMDDKEYTISWVTGAGEVFFEEGGFMYDYEVKEYI